MLQFYFLSVLFNLATGLMLLLSDPQKTDVFSGSDKKSLFESSNFKLILGILTMGTGFFKFLTVIRGDVAIVGDLFPALAGLLGGFVLLLEYYQSKTTSELSLKNPFLGLLLKGRRYIGGICLLFAVLHFLFPVVLFL